MAAETTTQEPEQEYGYIIDGEVYPEPENLTIDDHRIVKRYTGMNFRDLAEKSRDIMYVDQDGIAAIMHISYRHKHPEASYDEIAEIIGRQSLEEAQEGLEKAVPVPLDPTISNGSPESDSTPSETPKDSGTDSPTSSESSDESPATTGTSESDTSSPPSDPETTEALAS